MQVGEPELTRSMAEQSCEDTALRMTWRMMEPCSLARAGRAVLPLAREVTERPPLLPHDFTDRVSPAEGSVVGEGENRSTYVGVDAARRYGEVSQAPVLGGGGGAVIPSRGKARQV